MNDLLYGFDLSSNGDDAAVVGVYRRFVSGFWELVDMEIISITEPITVRQLPDEPLLCLPAPESVP